MQAGRQGRQTAKARQAGRQAGRQQGQTGITGTRHQEAAKAAQAAQAAQRSAAQAAQTGHSKERTNSLPGADAQPALSIPKTLWPSFLLPMFWKLGWRSRSKIPRAACECLSIVRMPSSPIFCNLSMRYGN